MHSRIHEAFVEICGRVNAGGSVLEVGAVPRTDTLLMLPSLANVSRRVGLNLKAGLTLDNCEFFQGNANDMTQFEDSSFDTVLCNAVLEHDPYFWRSLSEMRRVLRHNGILIVGVPGYAARRIDPYLKRLKSIPFFERYAEVLTSATLTFRLHNAPGDYYRFSPDAVRHVFLEGLFDTNVEILMTPPRIIGWGRKRVDSLA